MNKKLMSLGLVGILSVSLMVGCDSSNNEDDSITIKYVDKDGNIKKEKVSKKEAKRIEENQKQQVVKDNDTKDNSTKRETNKQQPKQQPKEDSTKNDDNYDDLFYGNAARGTCPDCGRNGMVFNHGNGLKCAYCGFYDAYYYVDDEPDQSIDDSNKDDEYVPDDNDYDDYDETQDYEESPSEPVEEDMN